MLNTTVARRLLLCIILSLPYHLSGAELETWDGEIISGEIEFRRGSYSIEENNKIINKTIDDTFEIRFQPESVDTSKYQRVTLTDGSTFTGEIGVSSDFEELPITLANGTRLQIKGSLIQHIDFEDLDAGAKVISNPPGPHCISRNGKTILCDIEWISYRDISIKTKAGRIKLDRDKIHRIGFARKETPVISRANIRLRTRYNDNIITRLVTIEKGLVQIDHSVGRLTLKLSDVLSIESLSENVSSLMSLEPSNIQHTPYLDYIKKIQFNKNLFGGPLTLNSILFEYGISMHSRSLVEYNINGQYSRITSYIGIDTSITDMGHVQFIVKGDGRILKQIEMAGKDPMQLLRIDVNGINRLSLEVDYGENGSSGDHAVWGNPRLLKQVLK